MEIELRRSHAIAAAVGNISTQEIYALEMDGP